jgi:hypothetical protein
MSIRNVRIPTLESRNDTIELHLKCVRNITTWHLQIIRQIQCGLETRTGLVQCDGIAQIVGDYLFAKPAGTLLNESWVAYWIQNHQTAAAVTHISSVSGTVNEVNRTIDVKEPSQSGGGGRVGEVPGTLWLHPDVVKTVKPNLKLPKRRAMNASVGVDADDVSVQAKRIREILAWSVANGKNLGCCMGNHRLECVHRMSGVVFNTCSVCFNAFDVREHAEERRMETDAVDYCSSCAATAFECVVCSHTFSRWTDLQAHMAVEAPQITREVAQQARTDTERARLQSTFFSAYTQVRDHAWGDDGTFNVAESRHQQKARLQQQYDELVSDIRNNLTFSDFLASVDIERRNHVINVLYRRSDPFADPKSSPPPPSDILSSLSSSSSLSLSPSPTSPSAQFVHSQHSSTHIPSSSSSQSSSSHSSSGSSHSLSSSSSRSSTNVTITSCNMPSHNPSSLLSSTGIARFQYIQPPLPFETFGKLYSSNSLPSTLSKAPTCLLTELARRCGRQRSTVLGARRQNDSKRSASINDSMSDSTMNEIDRGMEDPETANDRVLAELLNQEEAEKQNRIANLRTMSRYIQKPTARISALTSSSASTSSSSSISSISSSSTPDILFACSRCGGTCGLLCISIKEDASLDPHSWECLQCETFNVDTLCFMCLCPRPLDAVLQPASTLLAEIASTPVENLFDRSASIPPRPPTASSNSGSSNSRTVDSGVSGDTLPLLVNERENKVPRHPAARPPRNKTAALSGEAKARERLRAAIDCGDSSVIEDVRESKRLSNRLKGSGPKREVNADASSTQTKSPAFPCLVCTYVNIDREHCEMCGQLLLNPGYIMELPQSTFQRASSPSSSPVSSVSARSKKWDAWDA